MAGAVVKFATHSRHEAARFARSLVERGYRKVSGNRMVRSGCFRVRVYARKDRPARWYGVIYTPACESCSTDGHAARPAVAHGRCDSCWHKHRYRTLERVRESKKASSRRWYASLTPEQKAARQRKARVRNKLRRWAAAA